MSRAKDREIANKKRNALTVVLLVIIINMLTIMTIVLLVMTGVLDFKQGSLTVHKEINIVENKMDTFIMPTNNSVSVRANAVIEHFITDDMSEYEKVKVIHDWIVDWTTYDYGEYNNRGSNPSAHGEYGVFMKKKAVCDGYSAAFSLLCDLVGIETELVVGKVNDVFTKDGHAWNTVKIEDKWYAVDVTWNDTLTEQSGGTVLYDYFLVTNEVLKITHEWDMSEFENCISDKYFLKAYKESGLLASNSFQLRKLFEEQYKDGKRIITLVYTEQGIPSLDFIKESYGEYRWSYNEIGDACRVTIVMVN